MTTITCTHPTDERVVRIAHGYLGDTPAGTTETMCGGCGLVIESQPPKRCRGCDAMLPVSDPAVCELCDLHRLDDTHRTLNGYEDPATGRSSEQ